MNWWNELTSLQQIFATIAIPATLVMIIQFILFMLGFSHGDGSDSADVHGDMTIHGDAAHGVFEGHGHDIPSDHSAGDSVHESAGHHGEVGHDQVDALRLFTLRSIIAFMAVGGWMGVAAVGWKLPTPVVFLLALVTGWLALYFVAWSIRFALRMQQSGNVVIENAIGKQGEVYIPIPKSKEGIGKVNLVVQDRLCEFEATTEADRPLKTGEKVTVMSVVSEGVLMVMPKDNPPEGVIIEKF